MSDNSGWQYIQPEDSKPDEGVPLGKFLLDLDLRIKQLEQQVQSLLEAANPPAHEWTGTIDGRAGIWKLINERLAETKPQATLVYYDEDSKQWRPCKPPTDTE